MMKIATIALHRRGLAVALAALLLVLFAGADAAHGQRGRDDDRRAAPARASAPARAAAPARQSPTRAASPPARQAAPARSAERRPAPAPTRPPARASAPPQRQAAPARAADRTPPAPTQSQPRIVTRTPSANDGAAAAQQSRLDQLREQLRSRAAAGPASSPADSPSRSVRIGSREASEGDRASARQRLMEILNQRQPGASVDDRSARGSRPAAAQRPGERIGTPQDRERADRQTASALLSSEEARAYEAASQARRERTAPPAAGDRQRPSRPERPEQATGARPAPASDAAPDRQPAQGRQPAQERQPVQGRQPAQDRRPAQERRPLGGEDGASRPSQLQQSRPAPLQEQQQQRPSSRGPASNAPAAASSQQPQSRREMHIERRRGAGVSTSPSARDRTPLSEYSHPSATSSLRPAGTGSATVRDRGNASIGSSSTNVTNNSSASSVTNVTNISNVSNVSNVSNFSSFGGSTFYKPSFVPAHKKSPLHYHTYGHKPKTSIFLSIGSGKTSFFFGHTSSPIFFKPRYAWCPTWSYWSHRPSCHSWCSWGHPCHTSLWCSPWPRTTFIHTHSYSVLPRTHVIYQPVTTTVVAQPKQQTIVLDQPACPYTHREAWEFLAKGPQHLNRAVDAFTCLAQEHPYDGITVVGLSLATARAGDYDKAAALMRHAARVDVDALRHIPADRRIDEIIVDLLGGYSQLMHVPGREVNALFMVAALRTILHDAGSAHFTIGQAIQMGDDDASAFELRDLLVKMLSEELFPGP